MHMDECLVLQYDSHECNEVCEDKAVEKREKITDSLITYKGRITGGFGGGGSFVSFYFKFEPL